MPALGILGFQAVLLGVAAAAFFVIRHKWRNAVAKKEEIMRLVAMASEEAARVEFQATAAMYLTAPAPVASSFHCAVCYSKTTMRCSKCKSVRYCSGKCQIIHWRQGHKDECRPSSGTMVVQHNSDLDGEAGIRRGGIDTRTNSTSPNTISWDGFTSSGTRVDTSSGEILNRVSVDRAEALFVGTSPDVLGNISGYTNLVNCRDNFSRANNLVKMRTSHNDEELESKSKSAKAKTEMSADAQPASSTGKKPSRRGTSVEKVDTDTSKCKSLSANREDEHKGHISNSTSSGRSSIATRLVLDSSSRSEKIVDHYPLPAKIGSTPSLPQNACNGLKTSMKKVVQQFKSSKQPKSNFSGPENDIAGKFKVILPYELFVKLYSYNNVDLYPFGLINCGNSCYANAVLQCLAFTRPLTSYLLQGLHSRACQMKYWCFICEFENLLLKAREGKSSSSLSPIRILSKIHKIGSHLGHGKEEDAHEFLRYAVETMQSVFLKEAGATGPLAEQTTLVGMTFGGHLRSKIKCMKCLGKTEQVEQVMDLTVEIDGAIGTLEEALAQFTATETLDGDNRFHCNRCKSYEKARKKLTVLEAPNILTIVLKRFQSRSFEKLDKSVRFPEVLNLSPYMDRTSDRSHLYNLYAVVVHFEIMNAAYSGHYICYVKNSQGKWFKIDDSSVEPVELKRVLSEGAYMLLYARRSPRPPPFVGSNTLCHVGASNRRNSDAAPSSLTKSKLRYMVPSMNSSATQPKSSRDRSRMSFDGSSNQSFDPDDWRSHSMYRVPAMDSSSESSSILSSSDASSCSTVSTKDSSSNEDFSDYIFGLVGMSPYSQFRHSSESLRLPRIDVDMKGGRYR